MARCTIRSNDPECLQGGLAVNRTIPILLATALVLCAFGSVFFVFNGRAAAAREEAIAARMAAESHRAQAQERMEQVQQELASKDRTLDASQPATLHRIEDTLSRIEERLSALELQNGTTREPVPREQEDLTALIASLSQLREDLALQIEENRERSARTLADLKKEHPEIKWTNLQALIDLWHVDQQKALEDARLLSMEDVIERYGSPTELWSNEKGTNWIYGEGEDPEGGYSTEVWLCFQDGLVTMLGVK